jgi:hypothetical protein
MRWWLLSLAIAALFRPQPSRTLSLVSGCIPTAPMPIARADTAEIRRRYRMPVALPDSSVDMRMPVDTRRPCYWNDSLPKFVP